MTLEEFKSFKRGIVIDAVKFKRKKISEEDFYEKLVATFGKEIFEEVIDIMDNDKPQ